MSVAGNVLCCAVLRMNITPPHAAARSHARWRWRRAGMRGVCLLRQRVAGALRPGCRRGHRQRPFCAVLAGMPAAARQARGEPVLFTTVTGVMLMWPRGSC